MTRYSRHTHPNRTVLLKKFTALLTGFTALLFGGGSLAGTATIDVGDGNTATYEYRDDMLRINSSADAGSYAVFRDGSLYTVSLNDGQPMVIDAGSMMKGIGAMNLPGPSVASEFDDKLISFEDTGQDETVAGINGDVYEVRFEDSSGSQRSATLVLSTDQRVREFNAAMLRMVSTAGGLSNQPLPDRGQEFKARLDALNAGVLRYGDQMRVTRISSDAVPAERFELPAPPMNFKDLGSMLGNFPQPRQQDQN